jgi:hypothetical protein
VDNLEVSSVAETGTDVVITAPKDACMALQFSENDLNEAIRTLLGKAVRVRVVEGTGGTPPATQSTAKRSAREVELMERAMADPAVKSFKEKFPGAEVRQIRNLED